MIQEHSTTKEHLQDKMHETMQDMLAGASAVQRNARVFWDQQDALLDKMQTLADGWFQRRHAGAQAAIQACESMCRAKTPAEWLAAYQQWAGGAWERMLADGMACQRELSTAAQSMSPPIVPGGADTQHGNARHKKERAAA